MAEVIEQRNPIIAAIASFFIPGLGQVYDGEGLLVGCMWLVGTLIGSLVFILPGILIWLYGIYNAYKVAEKMNNGLLPYKPVNTSNMILLVIIAVVIYIIFVIVMIIFAAILAAFVFGISSTTTNY